MKISPPKTEQELLTRATQLAGLTLAELAQRYDFKLPQHQTHAKGIIGQLLERALGATAGVKSRPDFEALAIELKSIPVNKIGKPCESTYVCTVPLTNHNGLEWHQSSVYKKLARVLWIPVQGERAIPLSIRKIGMPLLWHMPPEFEKILKEDWEELMDIVTLGQIESITARQGTYLQIRPKAENSKSLRFGIGSDGEAIQTLPRGFYLRTCFTTLILQQHYLLV